MMDVQGYRSSSSSFMLAALCALTCAAFTNQAMAQKPMLVPPAPTPETLPVINAAKQPPLPPVQVETLKPELPENPVTQPQNGQASLLDGNWKMEIRPRKNKQANVDSKSYAKIYNSIPYRRSEYLANPSYRHDTTVEIMFGEMRPTVIHRQNVPQPVVNPRPQLFDPASFEALDFWSNPSRYSRWLPGIGRTIAPIF